MIVFDGVAVDVETPARPAPLVRRVLEVDALTLDEANVSIIGPNGGGKSTFLQLVNGLVLPTQGRVSVDGRGTAREGALVRRSAGFVFTDPAAQLVMPTPLEDVELSLRSLEKDRATRRERALGVLDSLGLVALAERSVFELSGGERQLVALACVLAREPVLLLLDEPTTLLDLANRARFERILGGLRDKGLRTLTCTHDLESAARSERTLLVEGGRIVFDGPPSEAIDAYRTRAAGGDATP